MSTINTIKESNAKHIIHPMGHLAAVEQSKPTIISSGEGVYVTDIDGHRMVDGVGGLWNVNLGYSRKEVQDAIKAQVDKLPYYSIFNGTATDVSIELSVKLVEMTKQENMSRAFFTSGGSDSVETALRLARVYWKSMGQLDRTKFISLVGGYHGTHFGAASVNGNTPFRRNFEPLLPGCFHVPAPYLYRNRFTQDYEELGEICAQLLEDQIVLQGPDTVAAFIAEPVMGAGGVIVPPPNYWPRVREICDKYGVLLIADEVVTGFGRSGCMFGSRGWGVAPDMLVLAKGITSGYIPLGAVMINERMNHGLMNNDNSFGAIMHGYTYSGHPVACAAAIPNLDIIERENIPELAGERGTYFIDKLRPFIDRFKSVGDVRGKGLMLAIEMVEDKETKQPKNPVFGQELIKIARAEGAMVRASGHKIILSPPLVITEEELDVIVDALDVAFSELDQ